MSLCVVEWTRMIYAILVFMSIAEGGDVHIECHGEELVKSFQQVHYIKVQVANNPLILLEKDGCVTTKNETLFPVINCVGKLLQGWLNSTLDIDYRTLPFLKCNMSGLKDDDFSWETFEPQVQMENEVQHEIDIKTVSNVGPKKPVSRIECTKLMSTNHATWGWQTKMETDTDWKDAEPSQVRTEPLDVKDKAYFAKTSLLVFGKMDVRCKLGDKDRTVSVPSSSTGDGYPSWLKISMAVSVVLVMTKLRWLLFSVFIHCTKLVVNPLHISSVAR